MPIAIIAELLQDATPDMAKRLETDDRYVFQEKHNGDRRIIQKNLDGTILDFNRNGDPGKGLREATKAALRAHPLPQFIIDVEYITKTGMIFVFDALFLGDDMIAAHPYKHREAAYHSYFTGHHRLIVPVTSARTPQEKRALVAKLKAEFAEGYVAKELDAPYRESVGNRRWNYRVKFVKRLDAVVIGDSKERNSDGNIKNSVRLGLYDAQGNLKDVCGVTKKSGLVLKPFDVVTILYLYGSDTLDVIQPRIDMDIKQPRHDKAARLCTVDQIEINKNWKNGNA
jgi:ATP-dependent DNA ligase